MKYITVLLTLLLVGCVSTPVKRNFPDVPPELTVGCQDLKKVQNDAQLSDVVSTVSTNYSQYHECRNKQDAWGEWYKTQKQIFESVK
jgi:hypothetical protein